MPQDSKDQRTLAEQRQANGQLVLQTLAAQERTMQAEHARAQSEERTVKAEHAQATSEEAMVRLQQIEAELRATAQFREELLGIVGHDLRNPLSAISMSAQFLLSRGNLGPEETRLISMIVKSTHRMDRMIRQLFEFTRARLGSNMPIERTQHELNQLCLQAVEELQTGSTTQIICDFKGALSGRWDGGRLIEAFSNIIGNAMDHALPETPVIVKAWGTAEEVVVSVQNQGAPIPAELMPVLFAPFRSGRHGPTAKAGHLGLGLYVAHEIARAHGGTLEAQSEAGTTSFVMRLPRAAAGTSPQQS